MSLRLSWMTLTRVSGDARLTPGAPPVWFPARIWHEHGGIKFACL